MIINLSKVDFGGITGGKAKPEEVFDVQPTTTEQIITPTEGSVFSGGTVRAVTKDIDNNIVPENIKQGVSILGVEGTLSSGGGSDVFVVPAELRFGFSKFTEIPSNWDFREFSNVTDASSMFLNCANLTAIPQMDTSKITNALQMFSGCESITTIPQLDFSSLINASGMFSYCKNLTTIPQLNLSSVTYASNMFGKCTSLTTIPQLNLSSITDASGMFSNCANLTSISRLNTSNVQNISNMFLLCKHLTTVEGIDFSGLTSDLSRLFGSITSMPNITRFIVNGKINVNATGKGSIAALTAIDYDSVKSILAAADRTDNTNAKTLAFNRTMTDQNGELAALVSSCTSKGWTISGLTLQ